MGGCAGGMAWSARGGLAHVQSTGVGAGAAEAGSYAAPRPRKQDAAESVNAVDDDGRVRACQV